MVEQSSEKQNRVQSVLEEMYAKLPEVSPGLAESYEEFVNASSEEDNEITIASSMGAFTQRGLVDHFRKSTTLGRLIASEYMEATREELAEMGVRNLTEERVVWALTEGFRLAAGELRREKLT